MKIESMPLNVVLQLVRGELLSSYNPDEITIVGVGIDNDFRELDEDGNCTITVFADMTFEDESCGENGAHPWIMVWDEETCDFNTVMRIDQKPNKRKNK